MKETLKMKVIGIGGAGKNVLHDVMQTLPGRVECALIAEEMLLMQSGAKDQVKLSLDVLECFRNNRALPPAVMPSLLEDIEHVLFGVDILFIAAGLGGGTGTGLAPLVAEQAKARGIATLALVTRPFTFEGERRRQRAAEGIEALKGFADSVLVADNGELLSLMDKNMGLEDAFKIVNQFFAQEIRERCDSLNAQEIDSLSMGMKKIILQSRGETLKDFWQKHR